MKKFTLSLITCVALLSLASCTKQYDTVVSNSQTGNSNAGTSGGFNWTGTAPFSAKVNGNAFSPIQVDFANAGTMYTIGGMDANLGSLLLTVSTNAQPGQIFSLASPQATISYIELATNQVAMPTAGKLRITANNATMLEGYFWADMAGVNNPSTFKVTEGYFKVNK